MPPDDTLSPLDKRSPFFVPSDPNTVGPSLTRSRPLMFVIQFRSAGWRSPLRPGDWLEVFSQDGHRLGDIPADLVLELLRHHVLGSRIALRLQDALSAVPADHVLTEVRDVPRKPLAALPAADTPPEPGHVTMHETGQPRLRGTHGRRLKGRKEA